MPNPNLAIFAALREKKILNLVFGYRSVLFAVGPHGFAAKTAMGERA